MTVVQDISPQLVATREIAGRTYEVFQAAPARFMIRIRIGDSSGWVMQKRQIVWDSGIRRKWRKLETAQRYLDSLERQARDSGKETLE